MLCSEKRLNRHVSGSQLKAVTWRSIPSLLQAAACKQLSVRGAVGQNVNALHLRTTPMFLTNCVKSRNSIRKRPCAVWQTSRSHIIPDIRCTGHELLAPAQARGSAAQGSSILKAASLSTLNLAGLPLFASHVSMSWAQWVTSIIIRPNAWRLHSIVSVAHFEHRAIG